MIGKSRYDTLSQEFRVVTGLNQGNNLSPSVFNSVRKSPKRYTNDRLWYKRN